MLQSKINTHGDIHPEELARCGINFSELLDFSSNINPYGPSAGMIEEIRNAVLNTYPDTACHAAREAIGRKEDLPFEKILLGNGSTELMWAAASALITTGSKVLFAEPAFSEFRSAAKKRGAKIIENFAKEEDDFSHKILSLINDITFFKPEIVFLCSPSNPSGRCLDYEELKEMSDHFPETLFFFDQAFLSLSTHYQERSKRFSKNVLLFRSLTKAHSIPGIRVGYVIGEAEFLTKIQEYRPPWTVSSPAQTSVLYTCRDEEEEFVRQSLKKLFCDRKEFFEELRALGQNPLPTDSFYFLLPIADASKVRIKFLKRKILVRDCSSFSLPNHLRLCSRPDADRKNFFKVWKEIFS